MKKTIIMSIVAAAGLAVSGLATAAAPSGTAAAGNWYIGIGANYNAIQKDKYRFLTYNPDWSPFDILEIDDHDIGVNLFVGNRLTDHFANELGVDLIGDTKWVNYEPGFKNEFRNNLKIHNIYHVYYDGYFFIPLMHPSFEAFAKGGVSYLEAKNNIKFHNYSPASVDTEFSSTVRTFALNYGAGVQFNAQQFGIRGEYTRVVPCHDIDDLHAFTDTINLDFIWFLS